VLTTTASQDSTAAAVWLSTLGAVCPDVTVLIAAEYGCYFGAILLTVFAQY